MPVGGPGRTVFMTLSICSMLVYAYYTSAVVSALMNSGRGGPYTLRGLADSSLAIASDGNEWMRYAFFDVSVLVNLNFSIDISPSLEFQRKTWVFRIQSKMFLTLAKF